MAKGSFTKLFVEAFRLLACASVIFLLCLSPSSSAQTQIVCGQVVNSSIDVNGEVDRYTFSASAGDAVTLRMVPSTNNFTPQMTLYDPNNQPLKNDWRLIIQSLTLTGTYTIAVNDSGFSSSRTGGYQLLWQRTKNPCNPTPIAPCQTLKGNVRTAVDLNAYQFNGAIGQAVVFQLRALTSLYDHASRLELYDPDGLFLAEGGVSSTIPWTLTKPGMYTVLVGTNLISGMAGNYTLTMGNVEALLTEPNGGEVWLAGSTVTIRWLSFAYNPGLASHDIRLSTDGGATFPTLIVSGITSPTYDWNIPPTLATTNARIRLIARDGSGASCDDDSDASFTVVGAASATAVAYRYDDLNRLIQTIYDDGTAITYTYDEAGNRLTETVGPVPYFRATCNPSSVAMNLGDSATTTCTITSLNGFSSAVNWACVAAPPGITCNFSPPAVTPTANGTASSTLTVSAALNTLPGVYSFQVKGTSGVLSRTFDMTLIVRDFNLTCNPASAVVNAGASGTSTCTVSSLNGFNSAVALSCSGLPPGVTCGFNPATVTPPANGLASSTLTINVASSVETGTFGFQVVGSSGSLTHTINFALNVVGTGEQLLLNEDFAGGIPPTWTVIDGGSGGVYAATWTTANPAGRSIAAPFVSPFAMVDSDYAGGDATQDEQLITPTINAGSCGQVVLEFSNQFQWFFRHLDEVADVDLSTDGGSTWTNMLRMQGNHDGFPTPNTKSIDLTPLIGGNRANIKIRFHYYNGTYEWWWAIDNVKVRCFPCAFGLSPTGQFFSRRGGAGSVNVTTNAGCSWVAANNLSWVTVVSNNNGSGNGTVNFEVRENFTGSARQGLLSLGGQSFTVVQDAGLGEACNYAISPTTQAFTSSGGAGTVNVTADGRCAWQAVSNAEWITITSTRVGIGSGIVTYSVAANPGTGARDGRITVAGKTIFVKQQ